MACNYVAARIHRFGEPLGAWRLSAWDSSISEIRYDDLVRIWRRSGSLSLFNRTCRFARGSGILVGRVTKSQCLGLRGRVFRFDFPGSPGNPIPRTPLPEYVQLIKADRYSAFVIAEAEDHH